MVTVADPVAPEPPVADPELPERPATSDGHDALIDVFVTPLPVLPPRHPPSVPGSVSGSASGSRRTSGGGSQVGVSPPSSQRVFVFYPCLSTLHHLCTSPALTAHRRFMKVLPSFTATHARRARRW